MSRTSEGGGAVLAVGLIVAWLVFGPWLAAWAINTVFGTAIVIDSFAKWLALAFLIAVATS